MGVFDLPAPLLQLIDNGITFVHPTLRLALWSILAGALSMGLYALLSPQNRISKVKAAQKESQRLLAESDESFSELIAVAKKTLGLSFQHLGLVFGPALMSGIPLICIMAWSSCNFGYAFPKPGEQINLTVQPTSSASSVHWQKGDSVATSVTEGGWTIRWPEQTRQLVFADKQRATQLELPLAAPIPQIHKRLWWNSLLGNPAGYLPDDAQMEMILVELPERQYLPFGPGWFSHWITLFLLASVAGALSTKKIFRIH